MTTILVLCGSVLFAALILVPVCMLIIRDKKKRLEMVNADQEQQRLIDRIDAANQYFTQNKLKPGDIIFFRAPDNSAHHDVILVICRTPRGQTYRVSDGVTTCVWYERFFVQTHLDRMRFIRRDDVSPSNQRELITCCLMLAEQISRHTACPSDSPLAREEAAWKSR